MKIYEKPMALIEKIEVEDVITASFVVEAGSANEGLILPGSTEAIVFEW